MQESSSGLAAVLALAALSALIGRDLHAQGPQDLDGLSGEALYQAACANCHGFDGRGVEQALLGFEEEVPDFTDCDFAAREPDGDWIGVAHEGGPVRGFSEMMPAFGAAMTPAQLGQVMSYIRTLCTDPSWPRGELNLPRALLTEKAYPEDEWVVEAGGALEGDRDVSTAFVYEQRFGSRSQFEVVIPFGWTQRQIPEAPNGKDWAGGLGDIVLGVKHAVLHDFEAGTIFSLGGEIILPTGDESKGLGASGSTAEAFASFGQILPGDAFLQAQAGIEAPLYDGADNEGFARIAVGRSYSQANWGRTWTPMVELSMKRDFETGADIQVDVVPQFQVSLNTRQHVLGNVGLLVPANHRQGRSVRLLAYLLLDWFDGGFFEGW